MDKQVLANAFREISTLESDYFRSRSYLNAVRVLENMSENEWNNRKSFLDIPGIGQSINTKIIDFKTNGILPAKLFKLREENKSYLDPQVYKVRKGFITKRIPLKEANVLVDFVVDYMKSNGCPLFGLGNEYFLGSYRRQKSFIADLDLLVVGEQMYIQVTEALQKCDRLTFVVGGPMKTTFVFDNQEKTTIDITWCDEESLAFSILHFTGSAAHNIKLRGKAKQMGYTLNQYGMFPNEEGKVQPKLKTEDEIFAFLNELYVEPKNR